MRRSGVVTVADFLRRRTIGSLSDRITHRGRERAIGRLQRGYICGALGTQTFERRIDSALTCDSPSVLRHITSDLARPSLLDRARRWLAPRPDLSGSGLLQIVAAGSSTVIGRSGSCGVVISHDSVSRRHAMLSREGNRLIITDLGSTNGTYLNGRWIVQAEVLPGDKLQLGQLELRM